MNPKFWAVSTWEASTSESPWILVPSTACGTRQVSIPECTLDQWVDRATGETHPRPSQDWTFSSRTRSHRTSVLRTHKPDPVGLLLPAPQTVPEVVFLPTSQALAPPVGSLPAYLKPTAPEARLLHLPVPPAETPKAVANRAEISGPASLYLHLTPIYSEQGTPRPSFHHLP